MDAHFGGTFWMHLLDAHFWMHNTFEWTVLKLLVQLGRHYVVNRQIIPSTAALLKWKLVLPITKKIPWFCYISCVMKSTSKEALFSLTVIIHFFCKSCMLQTTDSYLGHYHTVPNDFWQVYHNIGDTIFNIVLYLSTISKVFCPFLWIIFGSGFLLGPLMLWSAKSIHKCNIKWKLVLPIMR